MDLLKRQGLLLLAALASLSWLVLSASGSPYALLGALTAMWALAAEVTRRHFRYGVIATAALAVGCNAYLLNLKVQASGTSACNIDQLLNCDIINRSEWSELAGVPISLLGVALYVAVIFAAANATREPGGRLPQLIGWLGLATTLYSLLLGVVSLQIGALCVVCITIYACNLLLLVSAASQLRRHGRRWTEDLPGLLTASPTVWLLIVGGGGVMIGAPWWSANADHDPTLARVDRGAPDAASRLAALYAPLKGSLPLHGQEPVLGDPQAPYTVIEFADYGCPHCARAKKELTDLVRAKPEVRVLFKVFPLDAACNPALGDADDDGPAPRCEASIAAVCAQEQDRFWEFASLLFANQGYFAADQLAFMAEEVGLDMNRFATCMRSDAARDRVLADARAGQQAQIRGTPAVFLQGVVGQGIVEVPRGAAAVLQLVEAHQDGLDLPAP